MEVEDFLQKEMLGNKKAIIFIIILFLFIYSCSQANCIIYISPELKVFGENFLSRNPLPHGYQLQMTDDNSLAAAISITLRMRDFKAPPEKVLEKIIERQWLAPLAPWWEESPVKERGLVPLSEIALPFRGLAVKGLFPGHEDYPNCRETVVTLINIQDASLQKWFRSLKADSEVSPLVWIGVVGDIMPGRGVEEIFSDQTKGIDMVFKDTKPLLLAQDLLLGNLEGAVTENTERIEKNYNFKFSKNAIYYLKQAGFDYLSLTNNHSFDYGLRGFLDTLHNFKAYDMPTSGVGMDLTEAKLPWTTLIKDQKINILSLGAYPLEVDVFHGKTQAVATSSHPGMLWEGEEAIKALKKCASPESFDIVMVHAGEEFSQSPDTHSKKLFRSLVDAGADVVLGAHPHVLQGMEVYHGKLIVYSLGNFIFPGMSISPYCQWSLLLLLGVYDCRVVYINPVPVQITNKTISLDKSGRIAGHFSKLTKDLTGRQ
jgi:poly-gamma-glutamate capsule biosynthesis protein CapA/YwtB (metallophosphatase superfamily)